MIFFILSDAPFSNEVKLSNYTMNSCGQNVETDIKKVGNTIVVAWIRGDGSQYNGNWIVMSFDGGSTWPGALYYGSNDPNCWIGDPAIAIQPDNPNIIYFAGMVYCNPNNLKGEVYFCRCTAGSNCTSPANWSCGFVGPNDNWAYLKDKPWILALGNNTVLVNFTTDKFTGNYNLAIYKSTDNGQTWQQISYTNWPSTVGYWAKDGNNIYMSYNDFSQANNGIIYVGFLRSQDNGNTFSDIAWTGFNFGNSTSCPNYQRPAKIHDNITASSGNVAISFVDGNCKARLGVWTGSGNSLTVYQIAPSGGGSQQILPMLVSSGSKIFAQWQGRISSFSSCGGFTIGTWATYWSYSSNWGQTWSSPSRVSSVDFHFSENPLGHDYNGWIMDNGTIYTTWANDYRDNNTGDIYYSWTSSVNLEENSNSKKITIKYQNNKIIIQSLEHFSIYKLDGTLIHSYNKGNYEISLKPGIYFVKSNNFSDKFIVK